MLGYHRAACACAQQLLLTCCRYADGDDDDDGAILEETRDDDDDAAEFGGSVGVVGVGVNVGVWVWVCSWLSRLPCLFWASAAACMYSICQGCEPQPIHIRMLTLYVSVAAEEFEEDEEDEDEYDLLDEGDGEEAPPGKECDV